MQKIFFYTMAMLLLLGCNENKTEATAVSGDSTVATTTEAAPVNLPYPVEKTPDWERGDNNHVQLAMNTLRAFETNDMNALQQYLADSVQFYYDNLEFRGTRDSLIQLFTGIRSGVDTMNVVMHDYESVKSKNRGEEWVSLWYTESVKQKGGKMESSMVMDDIKIVNGKVAVIDSKMRRLPKK